MIYCLCMFAAVVQLRHCIEETIQIVRGTVLVQTMFINKSHESHSLSVHRVHFAFGQKVSELYFVEETKHWLLLLIFHIGFLKRLYIITKHWVCNLSIHFVESCWIKWWKITSSTKATMIVVMAQMVKSVRKMLYSSVLFFLQSYHIRDYFFQFGIHSKNNQNISFRFCQMSDEHDKSCLVHC